MPTRTGNYIVTVLLLASVLALALTLPPPTFRQAEAQTFSRTVPYVTVYQTVYVPVYVTVLQTVRVEVTATTTQSLSYTWYSTSYSVTWYSTTYSVTQWSTSVTTALGILGALPSTIFGTYTDAALVTAGLLGGVALALVSNLIGTKRRRAALNMILLQFGQIDQAILRAIKSALDISHLISHFAKLGLPDQMGGFADHVGGPVAQSDRDFDNLTNYLEQAMQKQKEAEENLKKISEQFHEAWLKTSRDLL